MEISSDVAATLASSVKASSTQRRKSQQSKNRDMKWRSLLAMQWTKTQMTKPPHKTWQRKKWTHLNKTIISWSWETLSQRSKRWKPAKKHRLKRSSKDWVSRRPPDLQERQLTWLCKLINLVWCHMIRPCSRWCGLETNSLKMKTNVQVFTQRKSILMICRRWSGPRSKAGTSCRPCQSSQEVTVFNYQSKDSSLKMGLSLRLAWRDFTCWLRHHRNRRQRTLLEKSNAMWRRLSLHNSLQREQVVLLLLDNLSSVAHSVNSD